MISTGTKTLDTLWCGGVPTNVISLLFSIPNLGKTWFCYQLANMCTRPTSAGGLGKKALYLDTEGFFFTEETQNLFSGYYKKRWPDCHPDKIEIECIEDIFKLGELFGIQFEILQEDKRVSMTAKFPTALQKKIATTKGKTQVETSQKDKDWLEKAPLWNKIKTGEYGLIVIDSLTVPIKSEIPSATQNFPARTSLLQILLGACYPMARRGNVGILMTDHITSNPMSPGYAWGLGNPWGGNNILYYIKHEFGLYRPLKDQITQYAPDGPRVRRMQRYRFPGIDQATLAVKLEKDRGYVDLPDGGKAKNADPDSEGT
jgi:hypothetical protein